MAISYNNLAELYRDMGNYKESEKFHNKALEIRIKIFGEQNEQTASSYHNLGLLYQDKKDFYKAKKLYFKALRIWENVLNKNHHTIGISHNNLAIFYFNQGDFKQAYNYLKNAIDIFSKILYENHPNLINSKKLLKRIEINLNQNPYKIKRNDPCPCNSGKKYKKCCGKSK